MRIAIGGIHQEASTFSRHRSDADFFAVREGDELVEFETAIGRHADALTDVEWVPLVAAMGGAGGPIDGEFFEAFLARTRELLANAGPLDGVYLDMHGAMFVEGLLDAEAIYVSVIRELVGPDAIISLSMDPHGNLSRELVTLIDLATCHRHSPHIDNQLTKERAILNLVSIIRSGLRPLKAWIPIPMLLPGEMTSTLVEPARSVFGRIPRLIDRHGVLDAGLWVGFMWADEPRNSAAVLVTGTDAEAISACAKDIASGYWRARERFAIVAENSGTWSEALDFALQRPPLPLYISDSGDNQTAGASSDSAYALEATLARNDVLTSDLRFLFAGFLDPTAVSRAVQSGVGSVIECALGGSVDRSTADPISRSWMVDKLVDGRHGEGVVAALLTAGNVTVAAQRYPYRFVGAADYAEPLYGSRGGAFFDASAFDVVVVKNGYLFPSQADSAASWFMALTPGGTDLDFSRLTYRHRAEPLFPFERDFAPALHAEII